MTVNEIIKQRNISIYHLSKISDVPYKTVHDICSGKTDLMKCSVETVYKIARALNVSMEDLIESEMAK